jgi:hypothetical protein
MASLHHTDWAAYYHSPKKTRLLNVISLEFSHSGLDPLVSSPSVVRQIDWITNVWPEALRQRQVSSTNDMATMNYPKVKKYDSVLRQIPVASSQTKECAWTAGIV